MDAPCTRTRCRCRSDLGSSAPLTLTGYPRLVGAMRRHGRSIAFLATPARSSRTSSSSPGAAKRGTEAVAASRRQKQALHAGATIRLIALILALGVQPAFGQSRAGHHRGRWDGDPAQRAAFTRANPCPSTGKTSGDCPGYVVDHRVPLACGGADKPTNMLWRSTTEPAANAREALERCEKSR